MWTWLGAVVRTDGINPRSYPAAAASVLSLRFRLLYSLSGGIINASLWSARRCWTFELHTNMCEREMKLKNFTELCPVWIDLSESRSVLCSMLLARFCCPVAGIKRRMVGFSRENYVLFYENPHFSSSNQLLSSEFSVELPIIRKLYFSGRISWYLDWFWGCWAQKSLKPCDENFEPPSKSTNKRLGESKNTFPSIL